MYLNRAVDGRHPPLLKTYAMEMVYYDHKITEDGNSIPWFVTAAADVSIIIMSFSGPFLKRYSKTSDAITQSGSNEKLRFLFIPANEKFHSIIMDR